ncbi:MAG: hypothetical protein M0Z85_07590 [Gammaproteobacteria bacterium]|nr:hypothetical protein [Gammaproteobacteria bacterium]
MAGTEKTQNRGHCQCCGRQQAVLENTGLIAKHGYTVENGWFQGVCSGHEFLPLERERTKTDEVLRATRAEIAHLQTMVAGLLDGSVRPATAIPIPYEIEWVRGVQMPKRIPYMDATATQQQLAVNDMLYETRSRITMGTQFVETLEAIVQDVHGQPLKVVPRVPPPDPIVKGECRTLWGGMVGRVTRVRENRVYYEEPAHPDDGVRWTSTRQWRSFRPANPIEADPQGPAEDEGDPHP